MRLDIRHAPFPPLDRQAVEVVERKGQGHPDSICDALAERLSLSLGRFYREHFGFILHHNVDKALLWGGAARPSFAGGEVLEPMELYLAGRAIRELKGVRVPVEALALEGSRDWLRRNLHALDPEKHVRIHSLIRPGSRDLVELFSRQRETGAWLANDTSCGVGFAPLSELETIVYRVERHLNRAARKAGRQELGEDIKVMGVRRGDLIHLTIGAAFIDRFVGTMEDYVRSKAEVAELVRCTAQRLTQRSLTVEVNGADDLARDSIYLTVTGTSAEAGDDGEAGRGNRANGLITPYRLMTLESVAGKNPVSHVGKLYNLCAGLMASALVDALPEVTEVGIALVSQIGRPVVEPQLVDIQVRTEEPPLLDELRDRIDAIAQDQLCRIGLLWEDLLEERVSSDRWPLYRGSLTLRSLQGERFPERAEMVRTIEAEAHNAASWTGRSRFSQRVMAAMDRVPRHRFVPPGEESVAYINGPLPIGHGQTISQPYIVALMTELAAVEADDVVLEVGTGSGYQAAVLAELVDELYTVERIPELAEAAGRRLKELGYRNVEVRLGDGYEGLTEHAPFDAILVTAAAPVIPPPLLAQLSPGGRLVIPVETGTYGQDLKLIVKDEAGQVHERNILPVSFVPLKRCTAH